MVRLEKVSFSRAGKKILDALSLDIPAAGVCIAGPSGCGKTTLLRLIAGLEKPDAGTVKPDFSRPAVMFQEDRLLPWLTAEENIAVVLSKEKKGEAARFLEETGLGGEGEKLPAELSGGMARRVALARALAFGGDALLLDEPFKGADARLTEKLAELILSQKVPVMAVLHSEAECALLRAPVLRFFGPPLQISRGNAFTFSDSDDKIH